MFQGRPKMQPWAFLWLLAAAFVLSAVRAQDELGGPGMEDLRNEVGHNEQTMSMLRLQRPLMETTVNTLNLAHIF